VTAIAVRDVVEEIAANAAALDAEPRFPREAFDSLRAARALTPPTERREEWALVRQVAKADGSVGRIFEGHLNAVERLTIDGIDPEDHVLGVWGADPAPDEGEPAEIRDDGLHGTKVFCSGAGGLTKALVIARGTLVLVDLEHGVEVDTSWYRAMGMRASESHRVHFHGARIDATLTPLTTEPYFSGDAIRTAAAWAGIVDAGVEAALAHVKDDDLGALAAGRILTAQATIDRWFEYAPMHVDKPTAVMLRQAVSDAGRNIFEEAARAAGSRPFATGTKLDRARRDFELFVLQHRLDPLVMRLGRDR
jgi:hypothetical protein